MTKELEEQQARWCETIFAAHVPRRAIHKFIDAHSDDVYVSPAAESGTKPGSQDSARSLASTICF